MILQWLRKGTADTAVRWEQKESDYGLSSPLPPFFPSFFTHLTECLHSELVGNIASQTSTFPISKFSLYERRQALIILLHRYISENFLRISKCRGNVEGFGPGVVIWALIWSMRRSPAPLESRYSSEEAAQQAPRWAESVGSGGSKEGGRALRLRAAQRPEHGGSVALVKSSVLLCSHDSIFVFLMGWRTFLLFFLPFDAIFLNSS